MVYDRGTIALAFPRTHDAIVTHLGLVCYKELFFGWNRSRIVPNSVLEAIKLGIWDFEPDDVETNRYNQTHAMPGSGEKLVVLAERVRRGLPLWHPEDRHSYDDYDEY